ncbi:hypothetical protein POM88_004839 [Heracleum sosnowskyi]|uniref:Histone deacetylase n=1 Tax=Heracleum sosnowskyi TaxID=360622 RepID=A0AAD8JJ49_9APIA|nr:hypothetical protein POM88_004839 [Heracleum sosnowskyi]
MLLHKAKSSSHLEKPLRIERAWTDLKRKGFHKRCLVVKVQETQDEDMALVHTHEHINFIRGVSSKPQDAGVVIEVARRVADNELSSAFAIARPPGIMPNRIIAWGFAFSTMLPLQHVIC